MVDDGAPEDDAPLDDGGDTTALEDGDDGGLADTTGESDGSE